MGYILLKRKKSIPTSLKKHNKYSNKWTECRQHHQHQSKLEARYCDRLQLLLKAKEIYHYTTQMSFELMVEGQHICNHIVDFVVIKKDAAEIHEIKGYPTEVWKLKKRLFEIMYPQYKYIVLNRKEMKRYGIRRK